MVFVTKKIIIIKTLMASPKLLLCALFLVFIINGNPGNARPNGKLKVGYYAHSCPQAEHIVSKIMAKAMNFDRSLAGPLLRMHFHDCFVRGCEGSLLLNSPTKQAEKDTIPNSSLRGFQIIDKIKTALEKACPRVVSCADILALVARDAVVGTNGPSWEVETGRRDGRVSMASEALRNLLSPFANITVLKAGFAKNGLSVKDLVVLSGGHTIGTSQCLGFSSRLYNFTGKGDTDPSLDSEYSERLRMKCKPGDLTSLAEMDPGSFKTFDVNYFKLVTKRRGLFNSDSALLDDPETREYVIKHATAAGTKSFFDDFGVSMVNMGRIGVLTGHRGEIRKVCTRRN